MSSKFLICSLAGLLAAAPAQAQASGVDSEVVPDVEWNARAAEHLLNRAGFGARPAEVSYALRTGREVFVEQLLVGFEAGREPFFLDLPERLTRAEMLGMGQVERKQLKDEFEDEDRELLGRFAAWWIEEMAAGNDPLRERMTLFWHGHFTSSYRKTKSGVAMIRQNELFREHALGNFGELLHEVVLDAAMIQYLDNDENRRSHPNENLARELMELFTLGQGHYTEQDVKEAARALTGWDVGYPDGSYFREGRHDRGRKEVLGVGGKLGAGDLVDLLLDRPECPRWIAGKLLAYFEGRAPGEERLATYAELLRENDYELTPFLRALFLDPEFYADEIVGNRIAGPIDYLVGCSRRLGIDPPARLLWLAGGQLGQRLFEPPNVKGWEGGTTWITTSSLLQRGNVAGMLLGVVSVEDVVAPEDPLEVPTLDATGATMTMQSEGMSSMSAEDQEVEAEPVNEFARSVIGADLNGMRKMGRTYYPRIHLSARLARLGASTDVEIVESMASELLAVGLSDQGRAALLGFLEQERLALDLEDGALLDAGADGERVLRRLAHLVLSLPEAQLV